MSNFTPVFPRSVSGGEYRLPLHHPDVEAVAARLSGLYESVSLKPHHRGQALQLYADLIVADECIWNCMGDAPTEAGELRPRRPILPEVEVKKRVHHVLSGNDEMIPIAFPDLRFGTLVGFVARVGDWVDRLDVAYGVAAYRTLGVMVERDEDGNVLPGEDI